MVNVFDELKELVKAGESYDLVILDPPSFVKKKDAVDAAVSGYKEILLRGLKLVNEGGLLAVFSCSYHVDEFLLLQTAMAAAFDAKKSIKIVKFLKQSADHPIDPFVPESYYLKGFLFQVTSV
jgi:23S rRNA (cytosine1962-C5)-methyltransferase